MMGDSIVSQPSIKERAFTLLALARTLADTPGLTWVDAENALYNPSGPYARMFPTKADRIAFNKTEESQLIDEIIETLPEPQVRKQKKEHSGNSIVRIISTRVRTKKAKAKA